MILWRISRHRDLSGAGGLKVPGRWHHAGHRVLYLAESPAAALLEVCAHTSANDIPPDFVLLKIEGPSTNPRSISTADLPPDWSRRLDLTRDLGTRWLESAVSVLLKIPSALVPAITNFLFNPAHPKAERFRIAGSYTYPFDPPPQALTPRVAPPSKISRILSANRASENRAARSCILRGSIPPSIRSNSTNARSNPASPASE